MSTTLNGSIIFSDTTINVIDSSGFTASGVILIDFEEISYTGNSSNQFTGCTRGFDSTVAVGHNSGVIVSQVLGSAVWTGETPTIANPNDSTTRESYMTDNLTFPNRVPAQIRLIASGILVPPRIIGASTAKGGGAFASNALDYTMRGFHVQLNQFVSWKAPFSDVNATQYFGNGGTPGTITNVVILSKK